ncbi:Membrane carboxypeptidase (penicillin-binding protein) [Austwickia chelonae]|uniref:Putative penicillin-binding protein n=1 Tax=Austwickia chelonae NBRC 105200 TaxID=1184607 RepID=K6VK26_9MICO|nr:transglycosylase domain-containing protein [Austwickia chelonae]GAB77054.1 putative penicillin-binding protein [Austwickia chelonae NBRC 105200]SEW33629.1 Membrane carboxypeptidase (penicillin-binding protein) [Austwickia chelonae]
MQRRATRFTNVLNLMGAFLAASVVMGFLAAGLAIPLVGGAGATTKLAIGTFEALPSQLTTPAIAQQTRILAADGTELATLFNENRSVVPLSQVSPMMHKAQVAIEDERFYEHGGVDVRGLMRAFVSTMRGDKQGASTITQQYVRQSLITNALRNDNHDAAAAAEQRNGVSGIIRKLKEAKYAIEIEKKMSKEQILEGYLNLVFYGANSYGVEAAAQRYFSIPAKNLTLAQSAMIAGMAQQPTAYNPLIYPQAALNRRNAVLDRMAAGNFVTKDEAAEAKESPLGLKPQDIKTSCESAVDKWVCLYVKSWLKKNVPALGANEAERESRLMHGGLTIQTTFDMKLLKESRRILTEWVPPSQDKEVGSASAVVEPGTGKVLAISQSSQPGKELIWSVDHEYGSSSGFQIGSTAKMYAVVEALKQGMTASSSVNSAPSGTVYNQARFRAAECKAMGGPWPVHNVEGSASGNMSIRAATVASVNTAFADLATKIGVCKQKATMKDMGLHTGNGKPYGDFSPSIILGANNASPLTMAASYATLAANGKYCEPYPVESVTQHDGKKLPLRIGQCRDSGVSAKVAQDTTDILKGVVSPNNLSEGRDSAAKTGTSDGNAQTWMVGYTPQRSAAVWTGRPNNNKSMQGIRIGSRYWGNPYGGTLSGPSWKKIMDAAHVGLPKAQFSGSAAHSNNRVAVPTVTGSSEEDAKKTLEAAGFKVTVSSQKETTTEVEPGTVARTDPPAGTQINKGETVSIILAAGGAPKPSASASARPGAPGARPDGAAGGGAAGGGAAGAPGAPGAPGGGGRAGIAGVPPGGAAPVPGRPAAPAAPPPPPVPVR